MNIVFPPEIIDQSVEKHFSKFSNKSRIIYLSAIVVFIGTVISLFFVETEITIQSRGLIRSASEPIQISSPVVAEVLRSSLEENKFVQIGDTLLWLDYEKYQERIEHLGNLISENEEYLEDISYMFDFRFSLLKSDLFSATHSQYRQNLHEFDLNIQLLQKSYNRAMSLYKKEVIALTEIEEKEFELAKMIEEKKIFVQMSRNEWQRFATGYKLENKRYRNEIDGLFRDVQNYIILAPGSGFISNYNGIQPGSFVSPGPTLAVISPADTIIAEHLVSPKDIGYLQKGMQVIYQVDAYNYNEWGLATGKIKDISNDIYIMDNLPFFKVRCSLNETHLTLKNGYKGKLKNGLTTTARFKITKRTLAQLFFDKTDKWLNPKIINN